MKKLLLTLAVLALSAAAPVFAGNDLVTTQGVECDYPGGPNGSPAPDGGATALLAAISFGGLVIAKKVMNKR